MKQSLMHLLFVLSSPRIEYRKELKKNVQNKLQFMNFKPFKLLVFRQENIGPQD